MLVETIHQHVLSKSPGRTQQKMWIQMMRPSWKLRIFLRPPPQAPSLRLHPLTLTSWNLGKNLSEKTLWRLLKSQSTWHYCDEIRMKVITIDEFYVLFHVVTHSSSKLTKDYHIELKQRGVTSLALVPYESDFKRCQQAEVPAPWREDGREGSGWVPL